MANPSGHGGARENAGRKPAETGTDYVAVKLDRSVAASAAYVVRRKGLTLASYLTETLAPIVEREHAAFFPLIQPGPVKPAASKAAKPPAPKPKAPSAKPGKAKGKRRAPGQGKRSTPRRNRSATD